MSVNEIQLNPDEVSASFKVLGEKHWTASCDNSHFTLSRTEGDGTATVTITCEPNNTGETISGTITVTINGENFTISITQTSTINYIDLSADKKSNCYIVSECGFFKIAATLRGNGVVPESQTIETAIAPAAAKLLWSTFNTSVAPTENTALIKNVHLEDGYICFSTGDKSEFREGNAVVAALDDSGKVIWSWHIWFTTPGADVVTDDVTWMDRNLGALAPNVKGSKNSLAYGMFYQWGRKDPFPGPDEEGMRGSTEEAWPESELCVESNGTLANTIANPQLFLYSTDANYNNKDWLWGVQYNDLWGGGVEDAPKTPVIAKSTKTMFDPCPPGYVVPSLKQYHTATAGISKSDIDKTNGGVGNDKFYLTYPGCADYTSGSMKDVGTYSLYMSSATNSVNMVCIRSNNSGFNSAASSGRTYGGTVRCVKE